MQENKNFTIHKSKKSLVDKLLTARESLRKNLEDTSHRMEYVSEINGIEYINDARSSDLLSTRDTLKCVMRPIIWLAATPPNERDYALIEKYVRYKVKAIVAYGPNAEDMMEKLEPLVENFKIEGSLDQALYKATEIGSRGDVVLFSPSCNTVDGYNSFVERGNAFKNCINTLAIRV